MFTYVVVSEIANELNPRLPTTSFLEGKSLLYYDIVFLDLTSIFYAMSSRNGPNRYHYPTKNKEIKQLIYKRIRELRLLGQRSTPIVVYGFKENVFFPRKEEKQLMIKHLFDKDIDIYDMEDKKLEVGIMEVINNLSQSYEMKCKIHCKQVAKEVYFPFGIKGYHTDWKNAKLLFLEELNVHHLADKEYVQFLYNSIQDLEKI